MRSIAPFILIILLACAEKKEVKQKEAPVVNADGTITAKSFYPNGKVRLEQPYKDSLRHGMSKAYDAEGNLTMELPYVNNKREGMSKRYYGGGVLAQTTEYKEDKQHGMQLKYRGSGQLMSEARYANDFPCDGLKEYLENKKVKRMYPTIKIKTIDRIKSAGEYILEFSMSENVRSVKFYLGTLTGDCITNELYNVRLDESRRTGIQKYSLPAGAYVMTELNVVAAVETLMGNTYITQKKYHLAIEN